eukprot:8427414-Pyramimonas_sp.AAC.1
MAASLGLSGGGYFNYPDGGMQGVVSLGTPELLVGNSSPSSFYSQGATPLETSAWHWHGSKLS